MVHDLKFLVRFDYSGHIKEKNGLKQPKHFAGAGSPKRGLGGAGSWQKFKRAQICKSFSLRRWS